MINHKQKELDASSHLTRGAWIEILLLLITLAIIGVAPHTRCVDWNKRVLRFSLRFQRRTSHEVRGLKYLYHKGTTELPKSHLTRGAWIEIIYFCSFYHAFRCRTSHEVRGLKFYNNRGQFMLQTVAPHTRCVDWNLYIPHPDYLTDQSHLTRGAWIEIATSLVKCWRIAVAPHTRCVDWNIPNITIIWKINRRTSHEVRGLKYYKNLNKQGQPLSHLTRGAWIEIFLLFLSCLPFPVAPHTRCVDWNSFTLS